MLTKLRQRAQDEKGFTLIELLVVILIIGILAAIALPSFLSQQQKAQDSSAKSAARNAVSQMEACAVDAGGVYNSTTAPCNDTMLSEAGLATTGDEAVNATGQAPGGYTVTALSKSGKTFIVTKTSTGVTRTVGGTGSGTW